MPHGKKGLMTMKNPKRFPSVLLATLTLSTLIACGDIRQLLDGAGENSENQLESLAPCSSAMNADFDNVLDSYRAAMDSNGSDVAMEKARGDIEAFKERYEGQICRASKGHKSKKFDATSESTRLLDKLSKGPHRRHHGNSFTGG
jgi:hypothetical protein